MNDIVKHPLAMDGKNPANVRGDPIGAERYYSREFMHEEWDHLWTKIWHIAGRENQLTNPGDYIVHDFAKALDDVLDHRARSRHRGSSRRVRRRSGASGGGAPVRGFQRCLKDQS